MTTTQRPDELHDGDGYPTDEALDYLDAFPGTAYEMLDYLIELMRIGGGCTVEEIKDHWGHPIREARFFTGGWSGCEETMGRAAKTMFHFSFWESSARGGSTVYQVGENLAGTAGLWGVPTYQATDGAKKVSGGSREEIVLLVEGRWNRWFWELIRADGEPVNLFVTAENGSSDTEQSARDAGEAARDMTRAAVAGGQTVLDTDPWNHQLAVTAGARALREMERGISGWGPFDEMAEKDIARWEMQSRIAATAAMRALAGGDARTRVSKTLARALRHEPELLGVALDEHGWAPMDELVDGLRLFDPAWAAVDASHLPALVDTAAKQRFEIADGRIRALYGHSVPGVLPPAASAPPAVLFHGTSPEAAEVILRDGLKPMRRQHVHLSVDRDTAVLVGRRKTGDPAVLEIDAADAADAGVLFRQANDATWLTDWIPAKYIWVAAD
ncbi:RNA 2'-phosphotransferase [Arthrobacter sp. A2-55]|uniref:RNA 2'-phosphotransferase n=1 Tax=Arthrobacter sp. A2-55 TaxID=2897337 RepID=UPI0021CDD349|nr:RNA 2'-phosphotransferase [Arthrobacter sp. A2-55]MCU6480505.1 RNA 2'-phosphotransferase [Arthrobacter sp. A2-55]